MYSKIRIFEIGALCKGSVEQDIQHVKFILLAFPVNTLS